MTTYTCSCDCCPCHKSVRSGNQSQTSNTLTLRTSINRISCVKVCSVRARLLLAPLKRDTQSNKQTKKLYRVHTPAAIMTQRDKKNTNVEHDLTRSLFGSLSLFLLLLFGYFRCEQCNELCDCNWIVQFRVSHVDERNQRPLTHSHTANSDSNFHFHLKKKIKLSMIDRLV